ncbi:MAG: hypothetical protein WC632_04005 [Candidatus Margulisiibacteriota bacterium]
MKMNLNKIFIILILPALVIAAPAAADKLEGSGYTLYDVINSGGQTLTGSGYTLKDSKGDTIGGQMTGSGYTIIPGLFGLGGGNKIGTAPWGTVPLTIARDGDNIKITWDAAAAPGAKIYVLAGDGTGQFQKTDDTKWKLYTDASIASQFGVTNILAGILFHNTQVGQGAGEVYYFGLQAGVTPQTICQDTDPLYKGKTCFVVAPAVGKANVNLYKTPASGWNFISSPLLLGGLDQVLGTDYTLGDQVWVWEDANQKFIAPITFDKSTWGNNNFNPGFGYLLNLTANSPKVTTMIGNVNTKALDRPISFKTGTPSYGWNLIGNPQATLDLNMTGFAAGKSVSGDSLWEWDNAGQEFLAPLTFDGTKWPGGTQLKIMKAYGYNFTGTNAFTWQVPAQ